MERFYDRCKKSYSRFRKFKIYIRKNNRIFNRKKICNRRIKKNEIQQIIIYLYNFLDEKRYHSNVGVISKNYSNIEIQEKIELPYELEKYILRLEPTKETTNKFEQDKKRILNSIIMLLNPIIKEENIKELKHQQKILTIPRGWC